MMMIYVDPLAFVALITKILNFSRTSAWKRRSIADLSMRVSADAGLMTSILFFKRFRVSGLWVLRIGIRPG